MTSFPKSGTALNGQEHKSIFESFLKTSMEYRIVLQSDRIEAKTISQTGGLL